MSKRLQLWSCGLGRQSVLMLGLIKRGDLPRPDHVCTVDTNRERSSSWQYLEQVFRPELAAMGIPFTVIDRAKYATNDLYAGADGDTLLIPAFTTESEFGGEGKYPEYCSWKWKREVVMRWADEQPGWKQRGVTCWLGITTEEKHRRHGTRKLWFAPSFPLLDVCPSHVSRAYELAEEFGWPEPPRSCCWMCPNMHNREWRDERDNWPDDFAKACDLDDEIRKVDPHAFVHSSRVPLRMADLGKPDAPGLFGGGCSSGMCY